MEDRTSGVVPPPAGGYSLRASRIVRDENGAGQLHSARRYNISRDVPRGVLWMCVVDAQWPCGVVVSYPGPAVGNTAVRCQQHNDDVAPISASRPTRVHGHL